MRKIFFVIDSLQNGGAERTVCNLANGFCYRGYDVSIIVFSGLKNCFYSLDSKINLIFINGTKKRKFYKVLCLRRIMKRELNGIFISFLPQICIYTYFASMFLKTRFILSERSDPNQYKRIYKFLLRRSFKKANGCVFQSEQSLKFYFKNGSKKSAIILNPVGMQKPLHYPKERKKIIFSVGRLMKEKNFPLLIDSFKRFSENHPDYKLHIIGNGPLKNELELLSNELNLKDKIIFEGPMNNWHSKCYDYACYVCSSNYEGMSNSLEEAACLGIPCVSTNCPSGGNAKLLNFGEFGLLVKTNSSLELSNAMSKIIDEKLIFDSQKLFDLCKTDTIINNWENFINIITRGDKKEKIKQSSTIDVEDQKK